MLLPILLLGALSFAISWIGTFAMKKIAVRIGFVDRPGHRKIHANPKPLGGGVAIFLAFAIPVVLGLAYVNWVATVLQSPSVNLTQKQLQDAPYFFGAARQTTLALVLLATMLAMHIMGLIDDRRAL